MPSECLIELQRYHQYWLRKKEPSGRYASIAQFSEDIRRHLTGVPVLAHKDTRGYRLQKFIKRHKAAVIAAGLVVASLITGMTVAVHEARIARTQQARAERRFKDVRALANSLIFDIHDKIQDLPGATPAREFLVTSSLRYLDSLAQEASGDLSLQRELASAYERVAEVQSPKSPRHCP